METLKNYIDFQKMWNDIKEDWKDDHCNIDDKRISSFIKNEPLDLDLDECYFDPDINGTVIVFCFSKEYQTANESDNQNEYSVVKIGYRFDGEDFKFYEEDHG